MPAHNKAARRPNSKQLCADTRKTPLLGERQTGRERPAFVARETGSQERPTYEPLISSKTLPDVPLSGLPFGRVITDALA